MPSANASTLTEQQRDAMEQRRAEADRIRADNDVPHWYPSGPVTLSEHVERRRAGEVTGARVTTKPKDS